MEKHLLLIRNINTSLQQTNKQNLQQQTIVNKSNEPPTRAKRHCKFYLAGTFIFTKNVLSFRKFSVRFHWQLTPSARTLLAIFEKIRTKKKNHLMNINTFWKIIIKSIGLWLLMNCVWVIPQFTSTLNFIDGEIGWENLILVWVMCFTTLLVYILATRLFLFKAEWIIKILELDQNFNEEKIKFEIPAQTVLSITITVIGAIWFLKSFPNLASSIFEFLRQKELIKNYGETGWLIYYFISTIIGFLIMTNGKSVSKYIWKENSTNQNG